MVAGLVPRAVGITDPDVARAVQEREAALAGRARYLAETAVRGGEAWARAFGPPPRDGVVAAAWWDRLGVVAAYRDRWQVTAPRILGGDLHISSLQQTAHRDRALRSGQEAALLAGVVSPRVARTITMGHPERGSRTGRGPLNEPGRERGQRSRQAGSRYSA
jgi:hypothetical protein